MKRITSERKGFTLMITLIALVLMSIFGLAIVTVTTSSFKMTKIDGKSQSTYYIAEAGANHAVYDISQKVDELSNITLSHDAFFERLDDYLEPYIKSGSEVTLRDFENNLGDPPLAHLKINDIKIVKEEDGGTYSERVVNYKINSKGEIGRSNRLVTTSINVAHRIDKAKERNQAFDYLMYSGGNNTVAIPSGSIVGGSIYGYNINFNASGTKINGNIISETSISLSDNMEVTGDLYGMNGTVSILSSGTKVTGDIHAKDKVTLNSGTTLTGDIYTNKGVILASSGAKAYNIHAGEDVNLGSGAQVSNIYTNGSVKFSSNNTITGEIHAGGNVGDNVTGGNVKVLGNIFSGANVVTRSWQAYEFLKSVYARGNIENGSGNSIFGDAISAAKIINSGIIKGQNIENGNPQQLQQPIGPQPPSFDIFKIDEKPKLNEQLQAYEPDSTTEIISTNTVRLSPGNYGIVKFDTNQGGTLILESGGSYFFDSITGENQKKTLGLDLSKGDNINIYIKNQFKWNGNIEISTDGRRWKDLKQFSEKDQISFAQRIYWETHGSFEMHEGGSKQFIGTLLAKDKIDLVGGSYLVGALSALEGFGVRNNYGIEFIYASENVGSSSIGGTVGQPGQGQNTLLQSLRVTAGDPIREK